MVIHTYFVIDYQEEVDGILEKAGEPIEVIDLGVDDAIEVYYDGRHYYAVYVCDGEYTVMASDTELPFPKLKGNFKVRRVLKKWIKN